MTTLNTPAGKVRSQSHRRYVIVRWYVGEHSPHLLKPRVAKRSDSIDTIRKEARRLGGFKGVRLMIFDQTTGEEVPPPR